MRLEAPLRSLLVFQCPPRLQPGVVVGVLVSPATRGHFAGKILSQTSRLDFCKRKSRMVPSTFVNKSELIMKTKMGRPPLSKRGESVVFSVRLALEEAESVQRVIGKSGLPKPEWLRRAILAAARKK